MPNDKSTNANKQITNPKHQQHQTSKVKTFTSPDLPSFINEQAEDYQTTITNNPQRNRKQT